MTGKVRQKKIYGNENIEIADSPGLLEKISFGLGDFSHNGIFTFISTYLMFYYTDTVGLDLGLISLILMIGRVVDAVTSPIMGVVIDRTNTKMGKCRPFLLIGIVPVCLLMIMMFSIPQGLSSTGKGIMAIVVYSIFSVLFAFMNVPYSTMLTVLTSDNDQRITFNTFKNVGCNVGTIFVTATTLGIVGVLSKNGTNGFGKTAIIFAVLFLIGNMMCFCFTKERVKVQKNNSVSVKEFVGVAKKNQPWLILCGVQFLTLLTLITRNQGTIYYAKYYLDNEALSSMMLSMTSIIAVALAAVLPTLVRRTSIKFCVIVGNAIWCISMMITWFAGENALVVLILHVIASIGWGIATGMVFVLLSQTIDYAQWKTGKRPQGMFTSLIAFVQKMGIAVAGVLCSQILNLGGYVANSVADTKVLTAIKIMFCGAPFLTSLGIVVLMMFYRLDKIYPQIERDLKNGKQ